MKFEENWPRRYRGEVVQRFEDGHRLMTTDDGRQKITKTHLEPCSRKLKNMKMSSAAVEKHKGEETDANVSGNISSST